MASLRKQGHLELGKKKLEEFRKKKAAKQVASTGISQSAETDQYDNPTNNLHTVDDYSSGRDDTAAAQTSIVGSSQNSDVDPLSNMPATSTAWKNENHSSHGVSVLDVNNMTSKLPVNSTFPGLANGYYENWTDKIELGSSEESKIGSSDGLKADKHIISGPVSTKPYNATTTNNLNLNFHNDQSGDSEKINSSVSHFHGMKKSSVNNIGSFPEKLESLSAINNLGHLSTPDNRHDVEQSSQRSNLGNHGTVGPGGRIADAISRRLNVDNSTWRGTESSSVGFNSAYGSSSSEVKFPLTGHGTTFGRSRPSFLDSLGVPRAASMSSILPSKPDSIVAPLSSLTFQNTEAKLSSSVQQPSADNSIEQSLGLTTPGLSSDKQPSLNTFISLNENQQQNLATDQNLHRELEFPSSGKDEDFASLEQHIEDLTKRNFSLQRELETAQKLSESLAAENSSLTDRFNQQGEVVNQLKSDMERLQEEIKAQMLGLESVKMECLNAQLECNAADERAKLLASEVINLEEKALRLRSNELKLEKQLDNMNSEIASYKRKVSVLEKERQDLQSTVEALQEEKKVLQSKLRKASTDGKTTKDTIGNSSSKHDASTSTDDLDVKDGETSVQGTISSNDIFSAQEVGPSVAVSSETSISSFLHDDRIMDFPDACVNLPQDQLRMIENIKASISELAVEKEELVQALRISSSNCSRLKDSNKDLSQKLEAQTQRLELLTAQRMASENALAKPIDTHGRTDTTEYADEGDEVVERVLGWIMKLFPGGPTKRRTSKLL